MKIHQIFINDTNTLPEKLPNYSEICTNSLIEFYGKENYHLYSGKEIEKIISSNFDESVQKSYRKLKPYAYKADLARYCLLYLYGGLYVDLNTRFISVLDQDFLRQWNFFAFRDFIGSSVRSWAVSNSIIFSQPKCKILEKAIEIIVNNCKNEYYGIHVNDPTGSVVLGKSIIISDEELCCTNGEMLCLNSEMIYAPKKSLGFFTDYGDFIALRKPPEARGGDMKTMSFLKTNNYVDMWKNNNVYDTTIII